MSRLRKRPGVIVGAGTLVVARVEAWGHSPGYAKCVGERGSSEGRGTFLGAMMVCGQQAQTTTHRTTQAAWSELTSSRLVPCSLNKHRFAGSYKRRNTSQLVGIDNQVDFLDGVPRKRER